MRFAIYVPCYGPYGDPKTLVELAVAAEKAGWDGFFPWDHLVAQQPVADPWVTLGAIAARTESITLGPLITAVPRRRPWKLALEASTLQRLSGGRLVLGVGMGVPRDYTKFGESAEAKERAGRLREGVALLRELFSGAPVHHEGQYYQVKDVQFARVDVPIWTSGLWPRKAPFLAAQHADGLFPIMNSEDVEYPLPTPEQAAQIRADFLAAGARPDSDLALWSGAAPLDPAQVGDYERAGVSWLLADGWNLPVADLRARIAAGPPR